jgi:hypothetical protein
MRSVTSSWDGTRATWCIGSSGGWSRGSATSGSLRSIDGVASRALMERAEDELRSRGFGSLWLDTGIDEGYSAARAMYEEMGYRRASGEFVISARIPADVESDRPWVDVVFQMTKSLDVPR